MKRREFKILGLSYSKAQSGSYVLVLTDERGIKIPIMIKSNEAQRIAIEIDGIKPVRKVTYTHDLIKQLTDLYQLDVMEIYIHSLLEGVFFVKIIVTDGLSEFELESNVADAVILSCMYKCPIMVSTDVINIAGIVMNDDGTVPSETEIMNDDDDDDDVDDKRIISVDNLQRMMDDAIADEDYETAAELRDRINKIK